MGKLALAVFFAIAVGLGWAAAALSATPVGGPAVVAVAHAEPR